MKISVHLILSGRVQGVGFRYYCREQASSIGVRGWVKNLDDGRVELLAEGESREIRNFVALCRTGPPHAAVIECVEQFGEATGSFRGFEIRF